MAKQEVEQSGISKRQVAIRIGLFSALFCALFAGVTFLLNPIWPVEDTLVVDHSFYDEPDNTIETIFFGASITAHGIDPMSMYENYGLCTFNLGASNEPALSSYYWLEEAYAHHSETLKTVVLDVSKMRTWDSQTIYRYNVDQMRFSEIKLRAVMDYTDGDLQEALSYLVPLFSYHNRWAELGSNDFDETKTDDREYLRGYYLQTFDYYYDNGEADTLAVPGYYGNLAGVSNNDYVDESMYYFAKMADFCAEHDIKLVLTKVPQPGWDAGDNANAQAFADEYGLEFIDFNYGPYINQLGFNEATDLSDGLHCNYYGAQKLSNWFGQYLTNECGGTDVRGESKYAFMEDELAEYKENVEDLVALTQIEDPAEYLATASENSGYTVFVTVQDDAAMALTDEQRDAFKKLGLKGLASLEEQDSYLAVIQNGEVAYQKRDANEARADKDEAEEEKLSTGELDMDEIRRQRDERTTKSEETAYLTYKGVTSDYTEYTIVSGGYNLGNTSSIVVDGAEYSKGQRGLNIVVYDNAKHEVVDQANFDTCGSATRVTNNLEEELAKYTAQLTDEAGNFDYTQLPERLQKLYLYNQRCTEAKTNSYNDVINYYNSAPGDNGLVALLNLVKSKSSLAVFISAQNAQGAYFTDEVRAALADLGLTNLSAMADTNSYIGAIIGGNVTSDWAGADKAYLEVTDVLATGTGGQVVYTITSGASPDAVTATTDGINATWYYTEGERQAALSQALSALGTSSIRLNDNEALNADTGANYGINVVVYDMQNDAVLLSRSFDTAGVEQSAITNMSKLVESRQE